MANQRHSNHRTLPHLSLIHIFIQHGGTALFTARSPEFNTPEGVQKAAATCRNLGIDGVVVIGGDGSFRGARDLTGAGAVSYTHLDVYKRQILCKQNYGNKEAGLLKITYLAKVVYDIKRAIENSMETYWEAL